MLDVAQNVLPVFLMIFIGWLVVALRYLKPEAGVALSEFVFKLAVPVLLFRTLAEADFHGAFPVRLWIAYFAGVAVTWAAGHLLATRLFGTDQRTAKVAGVSSAFANNVFIGLPLVERAVGAEGLVAVSILLAIHLPVMMVASSLMIERAERRDLGKAPERWYSLLRYLALNLTRNPLVFGVLGWLLRKLDVPLVPIILGVLLGNEMEKNLRRALTISDGDWSILWSSPLAIGLWTFAIVGFLAPLIVGRYLRPKIADEELGEGADPD